MTRDTATEHVIVLVQNFLNLSQEALREVLNMEVDAGILEKDYARALFNEAGKLAVKYANEAIALSAEIELEETKAVAPKRPIIFLPDGGGNA